MVSVWSIEVFLFLPAQLLVVLLLSLPLPISFRTMVCNGATKMLTQKVMGISLYLTLLTISIALFIGTTLDAMNRGQKLQELSPKVDYEMRLTAVGAKWRAERNFWLSAICCIMRVVSERFVALTKGLSVVEEQLASAPKSDKKND